MKRVLISSAILAAACSAPTAQAPKTQSATDVVAMIGTTPITLAEVDERALQQPVTSFGSLKLGQALYEARRLAIDDIVATKLMDQEAKSRGIERSALVQKEISDKVAPVGDVDVANWYEANQNRVQGMPLDKVRAPIRTYLIQERMEEARLRYVDTLKLKTPVRVMLEPPRQQVSAANGPSRGNASAPILMIEFSDFQCPFCLRAHATIEQVLKTYGDQIHFVYRNYPLPSHPNARPAAEAAACAADQGKFWPYHDRLFEQQSKLSDSDLKQHAAALGLDTAKFDACVDSHQFKALVDADTRDGEQAGVDGTPAFFINGRMLSGAQPFESFKRIIDEELAAQKK
jgi:protein-disulfide isomerase